MKEEQLSYNHTQYAAAEIQKNSFLQPKNDFLRNNTKQTGSKQHNPLIIFIQTLTQTKILKSRQYKSVKQTGHFSCLLKESFF